MKLTKAEIVKKIQSDVGFNRMQATDALESLLGIIKNTLARGEDVLVSGFGKFCVTDKGRRMGRNPASGKSVIIEARRVVRFRCSGKLRERINGVVDH